MKREGDDGDDRRGEAPTLGAAARASLERKSKRCGNREAEKRVAEQVALRGLDAAMNTERRGFV